MWVSAALGEVDRAASSLVRSAELFMCFSDELFWIFLIISWVSYHFSLLKKHLQQPLVLLIARVLWDGMKLLAKTLSDGDLAASKKGV